MNNLSFCALGWERRRIPQLRMLLADVNMLASYPLSFDPAISLSKWGTRSVSQVCRFLCHTESFLKKIFIILIYFG